MIGLVGLALHLVLGFFIASSRLVAPLWAVIILLAVWLGVLLLGGRIWRSRPWLALVLPLVTFALWMLVLWGGDVFLGWTA